jgi:hypothetical protein
MKIFIFVAMLFVEGVPVRADVIPQPSAEACATSRATFAQQAKTAELDVWFGECTEVQRDLKPQADPKHRDPKSEKRS